MLSEELFTREELEELGARTDGAILNALDQGDIEKARNLAKQLSREMIAMHDIEVTMVTSLLSFIGKRYGDDVLHEALHEMLASWVKEAAREYAKVQDLRVKVKMFARGLKGHGVKVKIEEDSEKFIFSMMPCGSGGKLIRNGSYGPPKNFYRVKTPGLMTLGKPDYPVYCAHCIFHEILGIEETGVPLFIHLPADKLGEEPCRMLLYKDPRAIPSSYYKRIGKKKPSAPVRDKD